MKRRAHHTFVNENGFQIQCGTEEHPEGYRLFLINEFAECEVEWIVTRLEFDELFKSMLELRATRSPDSTVLHDPGSTDVPI